MSPGSGEQLREAQRQLAAGQYAQAEALARQVLAQEPRSALALCILGTLAFVGQQPQLSLELLKQAVAIAPQDPEVHVGLGNVYLAMGKNQEAAGAFGRVVGLQADHQVGLRNLAFALRALGQYDESIAAQEKLTGLTPESADAWITLAETMHQGGRVEQCIAVFEKAIAMRPGHAPTYNNLSAALNQVGQYERAAAAACKALECRPGFLEAELNLGNGLRGLGRLAEAEASCRRALELHPESGEAHNNLAVVLNESGCLDSSIAAFRQALELSPDLVRANSAMIYTLHLYSGYGSADLRREHEAWNRRFAQPLAGSIRPHENSRDPGRRLRVGYVSPDFRDHVVGANILPLLREHEHENFEIFCYSNVLKADEFTAKMKTYADVWRNIVALGDAQAAELIREDRIDVLVDLALHTAGNRLLIFARKPAPVQVSFAGYPSSTGLTSIDYRLTDPYLDPPGSSDEFYSEKSYRLPHSFWCYEARSTDPPVNELPALTNGHVTFGSLNTFRKISPATWGRWARVLQGVPESQLTVLAPKGSARETAAGILKEHGIDPYRFRFISAKPRSQYMSIYNRIDIGLDTLPYNGHTTSLDSYWMGVPVVTLVGQTVVGRAGLSQATNLGLPELVAQSEEEFIAIATKLAGDVPRLAELRRGLRGRMEQSPLCDAKGFARGIEAAYRQMWQTWCARES